MTNIAASAVLVIQWWVFDQHSTVLSGPIMFLFEDMYAVVARHTINSLFNRYEANEMHSLVNIIVQSWHWTRFTWSGMIKHIATCKYTFVCSG